MTMAGLVENFILGISFGASLGPVSIEGIRRGLRGGFAASFPVWLGAIAADTTLCIASYLGLTAFVQSTALRAGIGFIGAAILAYWGYASIRDFSEKKKLNMTGRSPGHSFITGFSIAILSPITILWWLSFAGNLAAGSGSAPLAQIAPYIAAIMGGLLAWATGLSVLLHAGKRFFSENAVRHLSLLAGLAFLAFAAYFAYNAIRSLVSGV